MMNRVLTTLLALTVVTFCGAGQSGAQPKGPAPKAESVVLPITGKTGAAAPTQATLTGQFMLHRFASDGNGGIVAVGVISGTMTGGASGTVLTGPVSLPVKNINNRQFPVAQTNFIPAPSRIRAVWDHEAPAPAPGIVLAQIQDCSVLNLTIGGINLNLLGVVIELSDITLAISGDADGPLGTLICGVLDVLTGAIGAIVNLLNAILGLLGGLTGGLGAGLGGA